MSPMTHYDGGSSDTYEGVFVGGCTGLLVHWMAHFQVNSMVQMVIHAVMGL